MLKDQAFQRGKEGGFVLTYFDCWKLIEENKLFSRDPIEIRLLGKMITLRIELNSVH